MTVWRHRGDIPGRFHIHPEQLWSHTSKREWQHCVNEILYNVYAVSWYPGLQNYYFTLLIFLSYPRECINTKSDNVILWLMCMALNRTGLGGSEKCWFVDRVKMSKASDSFALNEHKVTSLTFSARISRCFSSSLSLVSISTPAPDTITSGFRSWYGKTATIF